MKRIILTAGLTLAACPAVASAQPPSRQHIRDYQHAYRAVAQKYGHRAPGRNLLQWGLPGGRRASDARITTSLAVLHRALAPAPRTASVSDSVSHSTVAATPSSSLAACIIQRESGGNPTASNGQYSGIAQWSQSAWQQDGGSQYAPTPSGASAAQQTQVLNQALANGGSGQWTPYDDC